MKRTIVKIDTDQCIGCGLCAQACQEGAIGMVDGKAKLLRDDYCDGLGRCLPACPVGAIALEEREAEAYDEVAVKKRREPTEVPSGGCPGTRPAAIKRADRARELQLMEQGKLGSSPVSQLGQWPVQIKLTPVRAPYFDGARILIAADCVAYAYADLHNRFMKGHITLIGCPKLDEGDYSEKLTQILRQNRVESVTVLRMEVPCCGGIERAVAQALENAGSIIPWKRVTISTDGRILAELDGRLDLE